MKKYKLKKDLPTFKAGDKFALRVDGGLWLIDDYDESGDIDCRVKAYDKQTLSKFPNIITDWFEEIPEEPKTVWDLKEGDNGWFIEGGGVKKYVSMDEIELEFFKDKIEVGDGFTTVKEAKKELARCRAKAILERDTKGYKVKKLEDWYLVYYNYVNRKLIVSQRDGTNNYGTLAFANQEDAEASIKAHPNEWKIYLGVEE